MIALTPVPEVFVGVDIAKGKHYACAMSATLHLAV